ncbi:MAG: type II secretion system protein [Bacilli bacterium]
MNKKDGFTLIELLAVIAILAILVVLTVPNIIKQYNEGKKSIFLTETKQILKDAENDYGVKALEGIKVERYCFDGNKKIGDSVLSNEEKILYDIRISSDGGISKYDVISGNNYAFYLSDTTLKHYVTFADIVDPVKPSTKINCDL